MAWRKWKRAVDAATQEICAIFTVALFLGLVIDLADWGWNLGIVHFLRLNYDPDHETILVCILLVLTATILGAQGRQEDWKTLSIPFLN